MCIAETSRNLMCIAIITYLGRYIYLFREFEDDTYFFANHKTLTLQNIDQCAIYSLNSESSMDISSQKFYPRPFEVHHIHESGLGLIFNGQSSKFSDTFRKGPIENCPGGGCCSGRLVNRRALVIFWKWHFLLDSFFYQRSP